MDLKFSKYEKRGHVAYITINRPEVYNAVHPPMQPRDGRGLG